MTDASLPNIRILSAPVANAILLNSIGHKLRLHYSELLNKPVPPHIDQILRQLS